MKKKLWVVLAIVLAVAVPGQAAKRSVTVEWDPFTGEDAEMVERVEIYQRVLPDGAYDYENPVASVELSKGSDGKSTPSTATFSVEVPEGVLTKYELVARAVNDNGPSEDSNADVWWADQRPLAKVDDLTAVYIKATREVEFSWSQPGINRIKSWKLFRADVSGGPYTEVDEIIWDGESEQLVLSQSIVPAPGEKVTYYFTVVAFANEGINSPNSNEVSVTVDRRPAKKVINLRVTID